MARTSSKEMEKKRTESRKDKLKKLYDSCKKQAEDLIPEGLEIVNISYCIFGIFIGILSMISCDKIVKLTCKNNTI